MFLKELAKNRFITIIYFQNGSLKTCKGRVYKLDFYKQTVNVKNEQQKAISIRLSSIKEIQ
ncbi:YolD-like family protein [Halalkalibacter kiskunsagensis]|uniref:YolD-like family protein n=1 Tax=Halalkalibacter kiskunsagensis TaxID=1548599 RepID=A0ABV6KHZ1_9BACI